jgi:PilZ domain
MNPSQFGGPPPRQNLRRCRRQAAKGSTRVKAYSNAHGLGHNVAAAVLDVSEAGARLLLTVKLAEGAEFELNFESAGSRPIKLLAIVVWSMESADGRFVTGVRFQKALSYADLQALSRS